jgi:hypothetical protein
MTKYTHPAEHPLPLRGAGATVLDADGRIVCECWTADRYAKHVGDAQVAIVRERAAAMAQRIARDVNAHDALVAALRHCAAALSIYIDNGADAAKAYAAARAALAKAGCDHV